MTPISNSPRVRFFCGNWKMNKGVAESLTLAQDLYLALTPSIIGRAIEVAIAPSFVSLTQVAQVFRQTPIEIAAQNCFWANQGSYTGEISPRELRGVGCRYVILGHSERRHFLGETDLIIQKKVSAALATGLRPILCVGETSHDGRQPSEFSPTMRSMLERQLSIGLLNCTKRMISEIVIAYEPTWAIGTGVAATPLWAQSVHFFIRDFIKKHFGSVADTLRIVYGGSVTSAQIAGFLAEPDIDGALVGGASLVAESFLKIVCYE